MGEGVGGAPREECNIRGQVINKVAEEKGILEVKQNTCNNISLKASYMGLEDLGIYYIYT